MKQNLHDLLAGNEKLGKAYSSPEVGGKELAPPPAVSNLNALRTLRVRAV